MSTEIIQLFTGAIFSLPIILAIALHLYISSMRRRFNKAIIGKTLRINPIAKLSSLNPLVPIFPQPRSILVDPFALPIAYLAKEVPAVPENRKNDSFVECVILGLSKRRNMINVRLPNGQEGTLSLIWLHFRSKDFIVVDTMSGTESHKKVIWFA